MLVRGWRLSWQGQRVAAGGPAELISYKILWPRGRCETIVRMRRAHACAHARHVCVNLRRAGNCILQHRIVACAGGSYAVVGDM